MISCFRTPRRGEAQNRRNPLKTHTPVSSRTIQKAKGRSSKGKMFSALDPKKSDRGAMTR